MSGLAQWWATLGAHAGGLALYFTLALLAGLLIGIKRGRALAGASIGLLLGPLGWWLAWRWETRGLPCPECGGINLRHARICRHCRVDLRRAAERSARSRSHARGDGWR